MAYERMRIFTGNANPKLADAVCRHLNISLGRCVVGRFSDGEVMVELLENVRGRDIFILQSTCVPTNDNLMEILVMTDALKRSSAGRITAVIPYYGYGRQDRKDKPRVPISAKLVANILSAAGADRVLCMDLHKAQIQGFFDIPVDHLFAAPVILDHLSRLDFQNLTIVAPDAGGAERARAYAKRLGGELAVIDKRRSDDGTAEVMNVVGDVDGRTCVIQDDIIDTAGTIAKAATALKANGAAKVFACAVHGVLSGPALDRIEKAPLEKLIVSNTIPLTGDRAKCPKIMTLSVAKLLAQAIRSIHEESSVSSLFV